MRIALMFVFGCFDRMCLLINSTHQMLQPGEFSIMCVAEDKDAYHEAESPNCIHFQ